LVCGVRLNDGDTHAQRGAYAMDREAGRAVFTPAIPYGAVTAAVNGELYIRAKRSIVLQVGESANRGRCINRQALRSVTAGLARLYPDNPNTSIQYPGTLSDGNCGANWTRAGMAYTSQGIRQICVASCHIYHIFVGYTNFVDKTLPPYVAIFRGSPHQICKLARLMKMPLCRMAFFLTLIPVF